MTVYTIGHSTHTPEHFLDLLSQHAITHVLDVRSTPYSKYAPQFNRESLDDMLSMHNMKYVQMGKWLGARPTNPDVYQDGKVCFSLLQHDSLFLAGIDSVCSGIRQGYTLALMCSEKDPRKCHRAILLGRVLEQRGMQVQHILADGSLLSQKQLTLELLNTYFPEATQPSLFYAMDDFTPAQMEEYAYEQAGNKIAYRT